MHSLIAFATQLEVNMVASTHLIPMDFNWPDKQALTNLT